METIIYLTIAGFIVLLGFITFLTIALFKAEKKLARYNASWLYGENEKSK